MPLDTGTETNRIYAIGASVAFADVDRDNVICLRGLAKILQEAAIGHANLFDTGTEAMVTRGESWLLNRLAIQVERYPAFGESLRLSTWSAGIRGFRGLREFRLHDTSGNLVVAGTSLWIFVNVRTQSIMRVPAALAERFPCVPDNMFLPGIERLEPSALPENSRQTPISLRYSDFDANRHVNNTAYFDLLQEALHRSGANARPRQVLMKYAKAIGEETREVRVNIGTTSPDCLGFTIESNGESRALGMCGDDILGTEARNFTLPQST